MGLHLGAVGLAFVSFALTAVGMAFSMNNVGFMKLTLQANSDQFYGTVGFNSLCSTTNGGSNFTCSSIEIQSTCVSLNVARNRWMGVQVSIVGGAILSLAVVFTAVGNTKPIALARLLIALFAFLAYASTGTFTYLFFYNWIGCDGGDLCSIYTALTGFCEQTFQWPWWLVVGAGGLSLFTFVLSIVAFTSAEDPTAASPAGAQQQQDQQQQPGSAGATEPYNENQQQDGEQQGDEDGEQDDLKKEDQQDDEQQPEAGAEEDDEANQTKKEAYDAGKPEDDDEGLYPLPEDGGPWTFDEDSGMWWSDGQEMYFHRESGQYYDYQSDMWYSEETGEWYRADGEE